MRRESEPLQRLNWGCGEHTKAGWINSDIKEASGVDLVGDIRRGLPLPSESIDYAVSVHALPELSYGELVPALEELLRVLKPHGVLRLVLPDLDRAARAYVEGDESYFHHVHDDAESLGGRFVTQVLWHGYSRSLFTSDFMTETMQRAGFAEVGTCAPHETHSRFAEIVELDNREEESFYIEGSRPARRSKWRHGGYNRRPSMPVSIDVTDVKVTARDEGSDLLAGHIDKPAGGDRFEGEVLRISGWVLGRSSPAKEVEVVSEHDVVGRAPIDVPRPDIAAHHAGVPGAEAAGFELTLSAGGRGASELLVSVVLEDGSRAQLCVVRVDITRQGVLSRIFR
jgi:predicted SAM-dependent methyltransferase